MEWAETKKRDLLVIRLLLGCMLTGFLFLGAVLWRIQVHSASRYRISLDRQSIRRVRLPGIRGRVFDRRGVCLADNRPSYCLAVYVEELRRPGKWLNTVEAVETVIQQLSEITGLEPVVTRREIEAHIYRRLPLPFLAWRDVGPGVLARWAESELRVPGVDIYVEPVREYPFGAAAEHLLGYVGRADPVQHVDETFDFYLPEMEGKYGIERFFNDRLSGVAGGYLLRVDASGFKHGKIGELAPESGTDLHLTLDMRIQQMVEDQLRGERGAAVVLDPRNGDVLALASSPGFDPNRFVPAISTADWQALNRDPENPLFNRAIQGVYAPGSTFKPVVAVAALQNQRVTPETTFDCPGYFQLGTARFHCWRRSGHGAIAMRKSIEQSCNTYYCALATRMGYDPIYHMSRAFGLGQRTGIELDFEASGLMPDDAWKRRTQNDAWRGGDTCNASIGQGAVSVTPLQMAMVASVLANGGLVYRPRLVRNQTRGELIRDLEWTVQTREVVRGGMHDVIEAASGTGRRAQLPGVEMAGKTGTAEYGPRSDRKKHAWMLLFAPYDQPRYAVAMIIEDAVSGGITVAPRMRLLMYGILGLDSAVRTAHGGSAGLSGGLHAGGAES